MPSNLNALIRYKTINNCLSGGRKLAIAELMEACSDALAESRGRYESISERTLRDDIRVMRSEILGFNAPIRQEKGLYYYSDPGYSIFAVPLSDADLAVRIIRLLTEIKAEVSHPELEIILRQLKKATSKVFGTSYLRDSIAETESPGVLLKEEKLTSYLMSNTLLPTDITWLSVFSIIPGKIA